MLRNLCLIATAPYMSHHRITWCADVHILVMAAPLPKKSMLMSGSCTRMASCRGRVHTSNSDAQAISLIVTHRTDDMSRLPPVEPAEEAAKPKQAAAVSRPKLALLSARRPAAAGTGNAAPPVVDMSSADVAPSTTAAELPPVLPEEGGA